MVVNNLEKIIVGSYNELYELYLSGSLGVVQQRIVSNLKKLSVGKDGTDEELIKSLLDADKGNFYHLMSINNVYLITIIGFNITKTMKLPTIAPISLSINFGESGVWEDYQGQSEPEWKDAGKLGKLVLTGEKVSVKHSASSTII